VGSIFAMFIVAPTFGLLAVAMVIGIYFWIHRFVQIDANSTDEARSSVFVALAEFAAHKASEMPNASLRAWKPNMLVPFEDAAQIRGSFDLLCDAALPEGSVRLLGLATDETSGELQGPLRELEASLRARSLPVSSTTIDSADYRSGVSAGLQALQSAFFRPNLLFLTVPDDPERDGESAGLVRLARRTGVGTFLVARHDKVGVGQRRRVTIWVRGGDWNIQDDFDGRNLNLALLMGYRISRQWGATLRLVTVISDEQQTADAAHFLRELVDLARLPRKSETRVEIGAFTDVIRTLSASDLNILGLQPDPDLDFVRTIVADARSTCLFVADSGRESALA
jgi:hypothetical protein